VGGPNSDVGADTVVLRTLGRYVPYGLTPNMWETVQVWQKPSFTKVAEIFLLTSAVRYRNVWYGSGSVTSRTRRYMYCTSIFQDG
jgi:hypothetical protein